MVSAFLVAYGKTVHSYMKSAGPIESALKKGRAQRAGFVCKHRLIIKSMATVRANIAYC